MRGGVCAQAGADRDGERSDERSGIADVGAGAGERRVRRARGFAGGCAATADIFEERAARAWEGPAAGAGWDGGLKGSEGTDAG